MPAPRVIYQPRPGSPIDVDREFYGRLGRETDSRSLTEQFVVPIRSGRAWPVLAGQICRIVVVEGAQVADFNAWKLNNPRERFWAARTKQLHRAHVTTFDRLWSCLPYLRPMLTITADTVNYPLDEDGAGCHDLLGTRCDPYVHKLLNGEDFDYCCHSNLVRAVAPYHLDESDVHDVLNIFQVTGLTTGRPLLREALTGEAGRLLRVLRRDRPALRHLHLSARVTCRCRSGEKKTPPTQSTPATRWASRSISLDPGLLEGWESPPTIDYQGIHGLDRG